MSKIKLLPEHLIDQIKAGEVIESPSALLKELLENSLDAKATRIDLILINNGMEFLSIQDNGTGMSYEDLPMAFCRHATSKIDRFEDLYRLQSYGFRGEALACISSVSRVTCLSYNGQSGGKIILEGGVLESCAPYSAQESGTAIQIKDLFFNTPVRMKFIKSKISEQNALLRIIHSFVLINPHLYLTVKWDHGEKMIFTPVDSEHHESASAKIKKILGLRAQSTLISFKKEYQDHIIEGHLSLESKKNQKSHFLFANQRLFTEKSLHQTIMYKMKNFWPLSTSGAYCLFIQAPPHLIDVNIHPSKTRIKFAKTNEIFSLLKASIDDVLKDQTPVENQRDKTQVDAPSSEPTTGLAFTPLVHALNSPGQYCRHLDGPYHLFQNSSFKTPLIIHQEKFLQELFHDLAQWNDDQLYPLLVALPLRVEGNPLQWQSLLATIGVKIDIHENQNVLLKTIPKALGRMNFRYFFSELLSKTAPLDDLELIGMISQLGPTIFHDLLTSLDSQHLQTLLAKAPKLDTLFLDSLFPQE